MVCAFHWKIFGWFVVPNGRFSTGSCTPSILAKILLRQKHDIEAGSIVTELRDHRVLKYIFTKTHSTTTFAGTTTDAPGSCGRLPECTFPDSDAFTERFCLNILENAFKMMPLSVRFKWQLYFILCSCSAGMAFTEWALFTLFHKQNGRTMFHLHIYIGKNPE